MLPLPQVPFDLDELEPAMSRDTLEFHYSRHHIDHYERTLTLARDAGLAHLSLEELVRKSSYVPRLRTLYRHAAEAWNHDCFWHSMCAGGGGEASGAVADCIAARFGSYPRFVRRFRGVAATVFGNGWLWLTWKDDRIRIVATAAGDTPIVRGHVALLALDLWEHAYYLDHQNRRGAYIRSFLDELVDWGAANRALRGCLAEVAHAR